MLEEFMLDEIKPKKDSMVEKNAENDIFRKMLKSQFEIKLNELDLDMTIVSNGRRNKNEQFHIFNIFIKDMFVNNFSIADIAMFLEEDFFEMKTVVACFNEENRFLLEEELSKRFNIKQKKTKLSMLVE